MVPADSKGISPVPPYSGYPAHQRADHDGTLTLYGRRSHVVSVQLIVCCRVLLPRLGRDLIGLGSSGLARHYYRNHICFLFLRLLRCFSSPRLPSSLLWSTGSSNQWVAPFGHDWISPCQRVPVMFRRLPRPSSPSEALGIPQTPFCCVLFIYPRVVACRLVLISHLTAVSELIHEVTPRPLRLSL